MNDTRPKIVWKENPENPVGRMGPALYCLVVTALLCFFSD